MRALAAAVLLILLNLLLCVPSLQAFVSQIHAPTRSSPFPARVDAQAVDADGPPPPPAPAPPSTCTAAGVVPIDAHAYPQQTPHSGRHFLPSHPSYHRPPGTSRTRALLRRLNPFRRTQRRVKRRRFMEGWYFRVTLPGDGVSFAFIVSIDDPSSNRGRWGGRTKSSKKKRCSNLSLAAIQVMGPNDEYLVQADADDTKLWAWEYGQGVGCTFEWAEDSKEASDATRSFVAAVDPEMWSQEVKSGFQMLPTRLQGKVDGHDGSLGGVHGGQGIPGRCSFDVAIEPLSGWGDSPETTAAARSHRTQRSTAGWLASYAVFEPHWQVTLSDARASGTITWRNTTYNFTDAPFYAEKNWGGAFPSKWYWVQCNSFEGYGGDADGSSSAGRRLSVTAGGGIRKIPFGRTESLGMVCIHYGGKFYEAVPWTGDMEWDVEPWGRWRLRGRCTSGERLFEAEVLAVCDPEVVPGVVLRAPTKDDGLAYFCKDSFYAETTLSLWELRYDEALGEHVRVDGPPIIDGARSEQGGVEVGGGPWWDTWRGKSKMKEPMKTMVAFPYTMEGLKRRLFERKKSREQ